MSPLYVGHEPRLDAADMDPVCRRMDECSGNIAVFCNSGFQRSLPFLCYYLRTRHPMTAPTTARAVDIVLPQVFPADHACPSQRAAYIKTIGSLLDPLFVQD